MAGRLKSTVKRIPWFLAAKALLFGVAWLTLPPWAFLLVALGLYAIPAFRLLELADLFALTVIFALLSPRDPWYAVLFGLIFGCVLGIKDLVFIRRGEVYRVVVLALLIVLSFQISEALGGSRTAYPLVFALGGGGYVLLMRGLLRFLGGASAPRKGWDAVMPWGCALLFAELVWILGYLPVNIWHQAALLTICGAVLMEFALTYRSGVSATRAILTGFSVFFAATVLILTLNT